MIRGVDGRLRKCRDSCDRCRQAEANGFAEIGSQLDHAAPELFGV